jgi:hypothetical protein
VQSKQFAEQLVQTLLLLKKPVSQVLQVATSVQTLQFGIVPLQRKSVPASIHFFV